ITANGCFILGLDRHTPAIFEEVLAFARAVPLYDVQITVLTPFPGTPLYDRLLREGRLLEPERWDLCTLFDVNYLPANMTPGQLRRPQGPEFARRQDPVVHLPEQALGSTPGLGRGGFRHDLAQRGRRDRPVLLEFRRRPLAGGEVFVVEVRDQRLHAGRVRRTHGGDPRRKQFDPLDGLRAEAALRLPGRLAAGI